LSRSDYLKDRLKELKHADLLRAYETSRQDKKFSIRGNTPNYFWYVTHGFDIVPPLYAGWMTIIERAGRGRLDLVLKVQKRAPRLHAGRVGEDRLISIGRLLSYRLSHAYRSLYKYWETTPESVEIETKEVVGVGELDSGKIQA